MFRILFNQWLLTPRTVSAKAEANGLHFTDYKLRLRIDAMEWTGDYVPNANVVRRYLHVGGWVD